MVYTDYHWAWGARAHVCRTTPGGGTAHHIDITSWPTQSPDVATESADDTSSQRSRRRRSSSSSI